MCLWQRLVISDNWNHLMRLCDMKYIGFKHQRENKQNSDKSVYCHYYIEKKIDIFIRFSQNHKISQEREVTYLWDSARVSICSVISTFSACIIPTSSALIPRFFFCNCSLKWKKKKEIIASLFILSHFREIIVSAESQTIHL